MARQKIHIIIAFGLFCLVIASSGQAQVTGLVEDFNDNILTGWQQWPPTFVLTEADSVLQIAYNRTSASGIWDNFNFRPPQPVDVSSSPHLSLEVKSDLLTVLTLKPVYADGNSDWLPVTLPADNTWHKYVFEMANASAPLQRIYMYLDGGSQAEKSGAVYFDNLRLGDAVTFTPDFSFLQIAIRTAEALLADAVEGAQEGQFAPGAIAALQGAVAAARILMQGDSTGLTPADVRAATDALYDACMTFESQVNVAHIAVIDPAATKQTKYLYSNLMHLAPNYMLYGMHDATGYGVGWSNDDDRSDVKDVTGSYPAVYSWDLQSIPLTDDHVRAAYRITAAYNRGGVNTFSWHQLDPAGRGFYARDVGNERIVATLLPGGASHEWYKASLRKIAAFAKSLRGANGEAIPAIFRPYHENMGDWFWWGRAHCTREEFIALWRFTVTYLRDSLNVHNFLYAYSPNAFADQDEYLERYPGDAYVDILGTDYYFRNIAAKLAYRYSPSAFSGAALEPTGPGLLQPAPVSLAKGTVAEEFIRILRDIVELARARGKVAALTETGQENLTTPDWHTRILLEPIKNDPVAVEIAYAAVWRNAHENHHFAPYPGHPSVPDFLLFFQDPFTLFEDDLLDLYSRDTYAVDDATPPVLLEAPGEFTAFETAVTLHVVTDERAYVRYSETDLPFADMPHVFASGQGGTHHFATLSVRHGEHATYFVRAMDLTGNTMDTSAVISFTVDTTQAPVYWVDAMYDDSDWKQGSAPLGFGFDGVTEIARVRTAYFRRSFVIDDPDSIDWMGFKFRYDDGVVGYLNGTEIAHVNMPGTVITHDTPASSAKKGFKSIVLTPEQRGLLRRGENVVAIEVHQAAGDTSDLYFDFGLQVSGYVIPYGAMWAYYDADQAPPVQTVGSLTAAEANPAPLPQKIVLFRNYPNPFNAETMIRLSLPRAGHVRLVLYDMLGRQVRVLADERLSAGFHSIPWDGRDAGGREAASGMYFCKLHVRGSGSRVMAMTLLK